MAVDKLQATFLAHALARRVLPSGVDILELGESSLLSNDHLGLLEILRPHLSQINYVRARERIKAALDGSTRYQRQFGSARALYEAIFSPSSYVAVDMEVGPRRICADLNMPLTLRGQFGCVINNGTSEHVFDQAQTFKTMHDHTRPGGTMIHWTPCLGWIDHGFYNVQPGFFFDLAASNHYEIGHVELADDFVSYPLTAGRDVHDALKAHPSLTESLICAVLRRTNADPFVMPMQGAFAHHNVGLAPKIMDRRAEDRRNLALGRPASQSSVSTWSWGETPGEDARGACNGIITGSYAFHTDEEYEPWWMVDLGSSTAISEAVVYNRLDSGLSTDKAAPLIIAVSDDGNAWRTIYMRDQREPFGGADGRPLRVAFKQPVAGRYVRLSLPGRTTLHLDEVEIY